MEPTNSNVLPFDPDRRAARRRTLRTVVREMHAAQATIDAIAARARAAGVATADDFRRGWAAFRRIQDCVEEASAMVGVRLVRPSHAERFR
jgi:hypothetical protein